MVAHPLHAVAVLFTGEDIETYFRPAGQTLRNLERFVQLMVGGIDTIDLMLLPIRREVGMKLNHGALWLYRARAVNLDLVIALGTQRPRTPERGDRANMHSQLRIPKEHHEARIHVVLLVAVEERRTGIVGRELYLHLGTRIQQDGVFQDALGFGRPGNRRSSKLWRCR